MHTHTCTLTHTRTRARVRGLNVGPIFDAVPARCWQQQRRRWNRILTGSMTLFVCALCRRPAGIALAGSQCIFLSVSLCVCVYVSGARAVCVSVCEPRLVRTTKYFSHTRCGAHAQRDRDRATTHTHTHWIAVILYTIYIYIYVHIYCVQLGLSLLYVRTCARAFGARAYTRRVYV